MPVPLTPAEQDITSQISVLMQRLREVHEAAHPAHNVWVHRRNHDMALACWTCADEWKTPTEGASDAPR